MRQEGEKPWSRTGTGTRQIPGQWVPASASAEGEETPWKAPSPERASASRPWSYCEGDANPTRGAAQTSYDSAPPW